MNAETFRKDMSAAQTTLNQYRREQVTGIAFENLRDHAEAELLYVPFMEPNTARLAQEWYLSEAEVSRILADLDPHPQHEYPELGPVYHRREVDLLAPTTSWRYRNRPAPSPTTSRIMGHKPMAEPK